MNKLWMLSISLSCQRLYDVLSWARTKSREGYIIHNKKTGVHSAAKYTQPRVGGLETLHRLNNPYTVLSFLTNFPLLSRGMFTGCIWEKYWLGVSSFLSTYRVFPLPCRRSRKLYRKTRLHPQGHSVGSFRSQGHDKIDVLQFRASKAGEVWNWVLSSSLCRAKSPLIHMQGFPLPTKPGSSLTLRRLMSYIYGAPILDVSRSHTTTQHSR